jgi:hypothetical protein
MEGKLVTILDFEALSLLSDFENSYWRAPPARWKAECALPSVRGQRLVGGPSAGDDAGRESVD